MLGEKSMKKMLKFLSLVLALMMIFSATAVPTFAEESAQTAEYPNSEDFSWGIVGHFDNQSYKVSDIEQQVALAAKLGVKLFRVGANDISADMDKLVQTINAYGMDVLFSVTAGFNEEPDVVAARFSKIANHYATGYFGKVKYFGIFNETEEKCLVEGGDANTLAGYDPALTTAMAARINAAHEAVKAASLDYQTVVNFGWTHDPYLSYLKDKGAEWDIIGINWYTNMQVQANDGLTTVLNRLNADEDLADKKVIITESNVWSDGETDFDDLKAIMDTAYNSDKVIAMCFYELLDEPGNAESERNFGFVEYDNETQTIGGVK